MRERNPCSYEGGLFARKPFGIVPEQVHVALDVIFCAVRSLCFHQNEIHSGFDRFAAVRAVPSSVYVAPLIQFLSPAVEYIRLKLHDAFVVVFGLVYVVNAVAVR